jgi:hypothetical protein
MPSKKSNFISTKSQLKLAISKCKPNSFFVPGKKISVSDKMQKTSYVLKSYPGKSFDPIFKPELSPKQMLELGVFEGKYLNDCVNEFPKEW